MIGRSLFKKAGSNAAKKKVVKPLSPRQSARFQKRTQKQMAALKKAQEASAKARKKNSIFETSLGKERRVSRAEVKEAQARLKLSKSLAKQGKATNAKLKRDQDNYNKKLNNLLGVEARLRSRNRVIGAAAKGAIVLGTQYQRNRTKR